MQKTQLIFYYANWCSHCSNFRESSWPALKKYIGDNRNISIIEVNGDSQQSTPEFVKYYPYIFIKKEDGTIITYQGNRTLEDLILFVTPHLL